MVTFINVFIRLSFSAFSAYCFFKSMSLINIERPVLLFTQATVADWPQATWYLVAAVGALFIVKLQEEDDKP